MSKGKAVFLRIVIGIAILFGTAGIIVGADKKASDWFNSLVHPGTTSNSIEDSSTESSTTVDSNSDGSASSGSTSSSGSGASDSFDSTSSYENIVPTITTDKDNLVLEVVQKDVIPATSVSAIVGPDEVGDKGVVWESLDSSLVTITPVYSRSGENVTVTAKKNFSSSVTITAHSVANYSITKSVSVTFDDGIRILWTDYYCRIKDYNEVQKIQTGGSNTSPGWNVKDENNYYTSNPVTLNDTETNLTSNPENVANVANAFTMCSIPGNEFFFLLSGHSYLGNNVGTWGRAIDKTKPETFLDMNLTTYVPQFTVMKEEVSSYGTIRVMIQFKYPTLSEDKRLVFNLDGWYWQITLQKYIAPSAIGDVPGTTNL